MWVGRHGEQELGGVAAHLYVEFDGAGVDPERFARGGGETGCPPSDVASGDPARRHPADQRPRDCRSPCTTCATSTPTAAGERLEITRDDEVASVARQRGSARSALSLLPGGRTRLHVDMDMQAADAVSYRNFMADLAALYRGVDLPELGYTYREYRAQLTASTPPPSEEDRAVVGRAGPGSSGTACAAAGSA